MTPPYQFTFNPMHTRKDGSYTTIKRIAVGIAGFTVLAVGVALIVLPGPAFLVIPLGLGILATEFVWARRLLKKVKDRFMKPTQ